MIPQSLIDQIDQKLADLRTLALNKAESALSSGAIPPHWETSPDDHRLSKCILDGICQDRPYKPLDKQNQRDFKNLNLFM